VSDVESVVEQLELVIGLAEGHVPQSDLEAAARAGREVRERVGYLGSTLVLALLGGTGVGKSSLLNAVAGERVASVSARRPHTTRPLAWVPDGSEPSLHALLDELGVDRRVEQSALPGVAVLDMTDVDSVQAGHRRIVESVLPRVDVALWVLDPVKYGDADLHRDFIAPSAGAADRMLFVLNRIDTVPMGSRAGIVAHLVAMLRADGLEAPIVFEVAADPPGSSPVGVEALVEHLSERLDEKRVRLSRVVDEARRVASRVVAAGGADAGGATGFERTWDEVCLAARDMLASGAGPAAREALLTRIEHLVADVSARSGRTVGAEIRRLLPPDAIEHAFDEAMRASGIGVGAAESGRADGFVTVLDERVGAVMREALWGRARLFATVAGLAVEAAATQERLARRRVSP
jgi:hypothetical protein